MKVLAVSFLTIISITCFAGRASASMVICTVEEISGSFGSFVPPHVGSRVTIDPSAELPSMLGFSGNSFSYIAIGSDVTRYTSSRIKVGYKIGLESNNPDAPEETVDFRIILDKENNLTINQVTFSNQGMRYLVQNLKASCK